MANYLSVWSSDTLSHRALRGAPDTLCGKLITDAAQPHDNSVGDGRSPSVDIHHLEPLVCDICEQLSSNDSLIAQSSIPVIAATDCPYCENGKDSDGQNCWRCGGTGWIDDDSDDSPQDQGVDTDHLRGQKVAALTQCPDCKQMSWDDKGCSNCGLTNTDVEDAAAFYDRRAAWDQDPQVEGCTCSSGYRPAAHAASCALMKDTDHAKMERGEKAPGSDYGTPWRNSIGSRTASSCGACGYLNAAGGACSSCGYDGKGEAGMLPKNEGPYDQAAKATAEIDRLRTAGLDAELWARLSADFSHQHYNEIAATLGRFAPGQKDVHSAFCDLFEKDNPRFDRTRFEAAIAANHPNRRELVDPRGPTTHVPDAPEYAPRPKTATNWTRDGLPIKEDIEVTITKEQAARIPFLDYNRVAVSEKRECPDCKRATWLSRIASCDTCGTMKCNSCMEEVSPISFFGMCKRCASADSDQVYEVSYEETTDDSTRFLSYYLGQADDEDSDPDPLGFTGLNGD